MGRIIVIDGTSNAGKTTLCNNLAQNMEDIIVIPGASQFAKKHPEKYPKIPPIPKTLKEEKENQMFFFELEYDRLKEANNLSKGNKTVVMDRSVLEILSVAYSFNDINIWSGIYDNAEELYNKFVQKVQEQKINFPDKHIWLQAEHKEIVKRNRIRQIELGQELSQEDWISKELIDKQIEFFGIIAEQNRDKFLHIDTNQKSKEEVMKEPKILLNLREKERDIADD